MNKVNKTYLIGRRFELLTVVSWAERRGSQSLWNCRCDCGQMTVVYYCALISGNTKSCGCLRGEHHGESYGENRNRRVSREYKAWSHAKARCYNPRDAKYKHYGGRGIRMCDEWRDSFLAFLKYMGRRPPKTSLDRINVHGDYEPGNCRWATAKQQSNNQQRHSPPSRLSEARMPESARGRHGPESSGPRSRAE